MEPLGVQYSREELLNELEILDSESRPVFILALMLRDGFSTTAPFVPGKYRTGVENLIRQLAIQDLILDWGRNETVNIYKPALNDWVAELNGAGWPPEQPRSNPEPVL